MAHILVLDDDPVTRQFLRDVLEKLLKHSVEDASRVESAVEIARGRPFDFMFLDMNLPDGTALDFCRALSRLDIGVGTPKCLITGNKPLEWDSGPWSGFGVKGCLVKPFKIDSLVDILNECLGNSRA